jgi:site-specific DNA-methyltransferase (adenine-specific)
LSENQNPTTESSGIVGIVNCRLPQAYWRDGDIGVLFNGKAEEVLPCIESESIDLTVTSPPYDNLRTYNGYSWNFETIAKELYRVTKPGGVCVWVVGDATIDGSETLTSAKQKIFFREGCGWNIHDTMFYHHYGAPSVHRFQKRYEQEVEYCFVLSKGKVKTWNPVMIEKRWVDKRKVKGGRREVDGRIIESYKPSLSDITVSGNMWHYNVGGGHQTSDKEAHEHPAVFPELLAVDHIESWSNVGDTVLDCFMGSGTTGKAAKLLKRKWVGIEISDKYCDLIRRRLNPPMPLFDTVGAANGS